MIARAGRWRTLSLVASLASVLACGSDEQAPTESDGDRDGGNACDLELDGSVCGECGALGQPCCADTLCRAGACTAGRCQARVCGEAFEPPREVSCLESTARCLRACEDDLTACQLGCLADETAQAVDGSCSTCLTAERNACYEAQTCRQAFNQLRCCMLDHCPDEESREPCPECLAALQWAGNCATGAICADFGLLVRADSPCLSPQRAR